jgi:hypothetical protein
MVAPTIMRATKLLLACILLAMICSCAPRPKDRVFAKPAEKWRAIHVLNYNSDAELEAFSQTIPKLAELGINVVIFEVDYNFAFQSHPELRRGKNPITKPAARKLAEVCRKSGVRLIPEFQSLGYQSWAKETFPLLTVYPQFDLTPGAFPDNQGKIGHLNFYCREWDVLNPEVYKIVFALLDEIIDAFAADAIHVGMDEVFLLGSEHSPSTRGKDPAVLYAKAINDLYNHLVKRRRVEMLMWGDRLIDGKRFDFGEWEASMNGTAAAVDLIPKDIIICPWHYEMKASYPSIPMFLEKGFRVLPSSWNKVDATEALIKHGQMQASRNLLGHLFTTWGVKKENLLAFPPLVEGLKLLQPGSQVN